MSRIDAASWPDWFFTEIPWVAFSTPHWTVLGMVASCSALLVFLGRRWRGSDAGRTLSRCCAVAMALVETGVHVNQGWPSRWDVALSLPFELCDWAGIAGIVALWTGSPWAASLLYYWGLTLTMQGLLTPDLEFSFPHEQFIQFMAHHAVTVIAAIYITWGRGFRPNWYSWAFAGATTVATALWALFFNFMAGSNYMYVCHKPMQASAFDLMGEWPWYLGVALCVGLLVWALITLPWRVIERNVQRRISRGETLPAHVMAVTRTEPPAWIRKRITRRRGRRRIAV